MEKQQNNNKQNKSKNNNSTDLLRITDTFLVKELPVDYKKEALCKVEKNL